MPIGKNQFSRSKGRPTNTDAHTLAIAGPKPFHNALTPSWAIVFRVQSTNPLYVPEGADCKRDLITCKAKRARSPDRQAPCVCHCHRVTYIRWDRNAPHGNSCNTTSQDNCAEVELGRVSTCGCKFFLRNFVRHEVSRFQMLASCAIACQVGNEGAVRHMVYTLHTNKKVRCGTGT
jgi:hypothetical protein